MPKSAALRLGLIGFPVGHSLSPVMHQHLLEELKQPGSYQLFETPRFQLDEKVAALKADGLRGFNVTIPFKQKIVPFLNEVDTTAQLAGAVNTVLIHKRKLYGFNTDKPGFEQALQFHNIDVAKRQALIFGAGGAARAVVLALVQSGVRKIYLSNRTMTRATKLVDDISAATGFFNFITAPLSQEAILKFMDSVDMVINTTSLGMWPEVSATPFEFPKLQREIFVVDLIYNPLETRFLKSARNNGAKIVDGLDVFIFQGIEAMQLWSGRKIDRGSAYPKLRKRLTEQLLNYVQT